MASRIPNDPLKESVWRERAILGTGWGMIALSILIPVVLGQPRLSLIIAAVIGLYLLWHRFVRLPALWMPVTSRKGTLLTLRGTEKEPLLRFVWRSTEMFAKRAGIPMPRLSINFEPSSYLAVARGNERPHGHVIISAIALIQDPITMPAALAHEVAHLALRHNDPTRRAVVVTNIIWRIAFIAPVYVLATTVLSYEPFNASEVIAYLVMPVVLAVLNTRLVQSMYKMIRINEFAADEYGAQLLGSYGFMAWGLLSLITKYGGSNVLEQERILHPRLKDRIQRLEDRGRATGEIEETRPSLLGPT